MTIMHVGYKLQAVSDGTVVQTWGGIPGQLPSIPDRIQLPTGEVINSPQLDVDYFGFVLVEWMEDVPPQHVFSSVDWMSRFANHEYALAMTSTDVTIRRMWDAMLALGEIDVYTTINAKIRFSEEGILTVERADIIWDTVPSSLVAPPGGP